MPSFLQGFITGAAGRTSEILKEERLAEQKAREEAEAFDKKVRFMEQSATFKADIEKQKKLDETKAKQEKISMTNSIITGRASETMTFEEASALANKHGIDISEVEKGLQAIHDTKPDEWEELDNDEKKEMGIGLSSVVLRNTKTNDIKEVKFGGKGSTTLKEAVGPDGKVGFFTPQEILEKGYTPKAGAETPFTDFQGNLKIEATNALNRLVAPKFGGTVDPITGGLSFADPNLGAKAGIVQANAARLLRAGQAKSVDEAVELAMAEEIVRTPTAEDSGKPTKLSKDTLQRMKDIVERVPPVIADEKSALDDEETEEGQQNVIPTISTQKEFDALPKGAAYIDKETGKLGTKP